jgi:hexokinase
MLLIDDGSTHHKQSFFDLRMRVCYSGELVNLHLVAISMFECHSAKNIFNLIAKFMDAL